MPFDGPCMKKVLLFLFSAPLYAENLIEQLTVTKHRIEVTVNREFKETYLKDNFFVEYDSSIDLSLFDYSIVSLPFVMQVVTTVWASNKDYDIDEMNEEVYASLEKIKRVFQIFYPKTSWNGRLIPKKLTKYTAKNHSPLKALLFSGGLDSTVCSLAHRTEQQLLITARGQAGLPLNKDTLWKTTTEHIKSFAQEYGHRTCFLTSNYYYFLNFRKLKLLSPEIHTWRMDAIEDIGWSGMVAPILLTHGIDSLYIGSSESWEFGYPSASHPAIDSALSFAGIRLMHEQFDMTRFDKIRYLINLCKTETIKKPSLVICQRKNGCINCCTCEKCVVTLAGFIAADSNPQDYGLPLSTEEANEIIKNRLAKLALSSTACWQLRDIRAKAQCRPTFSWFFNTEFKSDGKDKEVQPIDYELLFKEFPHLRKYRKASSNCTLISKP